LTDAVLIEKALDMARWPDAHGPAVDALRAAIDWVLDAEARPDTAELIRLLDPDSTNNTEVT
jgi:hypothetical protein